MNEAIIKAIKNGYKTSLFDITNKTQANRAEYQILLDPLFWQALGKGWEGRRLPNGKWNEPWVNNWHHFIDHLIAGKDIDSFFNELLSTTN